MLSKNLTAAEIRELKAEAQRLIDAIEPRSLPNLRDRAIIGVIGYAWAPVDAIIAMRVSDYYPLGDRRWVRFIKNGTKRHELVDRRLEKLMDEYLAVARIENELGSPLFRSTLPGNRRLLNIRSVSRGYVLTLVRHITEANEDQTVALPPGDVPQLIQSINTRSVAGLRDRAIIGLMLYASASPQTIGSMCVRDYFVRGDQHWIRLNQRAAVQADRPLVALMREYLDAARFGKDRTAPLFGARNRPITPSEIREMIRRRKSQASRKATSRPVPRPGAQRA